MFNLSKGIQAVCVAILWLGMTVSIRAQTVKMDYVEVDSKTYQKVKAEIRSAELDQSGLHVDTNLIIAAGFVGKPKKVHFELIGQSGDSETRRLGPVEIASERILRRFRKGRREIYLEASVFDLRVYDRRPGETNYAIAINWQAMEDEELKVGAHAEFRMWADRRAVVPLVGQTESNCLLLVQISP